MLTNEDRANYGDEAIDAGCPDEDDRETMARDAIANILHAVCRDLLDEDADASGLCKRITDGAIDYVLDERAGIEASF